MFQVVFWNFCKINYVAKKLIILPINYISGLWNKSNLYILENSNYIYAEIKWNLMRFNNKKNMVIHMVYGDCILFALFPNLKLFKNCI